MDPRFLTCPLRLIQFEARSGPRQGSSASAFRKSRSSDFEGARGRRLGADLCRKHAVTDASIHMESEVRRDGGLGGQAAEDAGGREHPAEAAPGRCHAGQCGVEGPRGKER
jgi:hypothetical protein